MSGYFYKHRMKMNRLWNFHLHNWKIHQTPNSFCFKNSAHKIYFLSRDANFLIWYKLWTDTKALWQHDAQWKGILIKGFREIVHLAHGQISFPSISVRLHEYTTQIQMMNGVLLGVSVCIHKNFPTIKYSTQRN